jgi:hypothetical protein
MDWRTLIRHPDPAAVDLVAADAAVAAGLPGMERVDADQHVRQVDALAASCRRFTDRVMPAFRAGQCDYPDSEGRFRVQAMVTHLQRDLGMRYHPDRRADYAVLRPEDSFLYGVLFGRGGTCGSLPLLYAAVGRRIGYPLRLVTTRGHLFCRWEGAERFNVEASGDGVSFFPDEHYRLGRFAMPPETVLACGYLETLSTKEEIAALMCQRGECWMQERNFGEATTAFAWAHEVDPRRLQHEALTKQALRRWDESLRNRLPPYFPQIEATTRDRQFIRLPAAAEMVLIRLRVTEKLLGDPELDARWWGPARRNPADPPKDLPTVLQVDYRWNRSAHAGLVA